MPDDKKVEIHIVLPLMPSPKDFRISENATADGGLYQLALNSWEKVCMAAVEKGCQLDLATEIPVTIVDRTKH